VERSPDTRAPGGSIEISSAGWFLVLAVCWDLVFNRIAPSLGLYRTAGAEGALGWLAGSGLFAMNSVGAMALALLCATLPRLANDRGYAPLGWRIFLMLSSPVYLPVICVAVFRTVDPWLVLAGYLAAVLTAAVMASIAACKPVGGGSRRILVALALIQVLPAFELTVRVFSLFAPEDTLGVVPRRAYLLAEVLFVATPVFAFFALWVGRLGRFVRRPHLPALIAAILATGIGAAVAVLAGNATLVSLVAFRSLGITVSIPGGPAPYLVALFFGSLLVGSLALPSRRWPPDAVSRRIGMGLAFVWSAGLQPTHPYLIALMLLGFALVSWGIVESARPRGRPSEGSARAG